MDTTFLQLLGFGLLAALGNVLGAIAVFPSRMYRTSTRLLRYLVALGAGFMLAVTLLEMLPRSLALWSVGTSAGVSDLARPMALVLIGYLLTQFFEHTIAPHFHLGEEMHCDEHHHEMIKPRVAYTAIGGLLVHTFFDGVSIAAAARLDVGVGVLVFAAVLLHKLPEGFTIGSMVLAAGKGLRQVVTAASAVGLMTIFGVLAFHLIGSRTGFTVEYALPLATGVTFYVAASDLVPEVNHHGGKSPFVSLSVFAGVALFFAAQALIGAVTSH